MGGSGRGIAAQLSGRPAPMENGPPRPHGVQSSPLAPVVETALGAITVAAESPAETHRETSAAAGKLHRTPRAPPRLRFASECVGRGRECRPGGGEFSVAAGADHGGNETWLQTRREVC